MKLLVTMRFWPIYCALTIGLAASATDFEQSLEAIRKSDERISKHLHRLGYSASDELDGGSAGSRASEHSDHQPLFVVHGDTRHLQAGTGKFLFGTLVHRLVIGGDNSPVIVQVGQGQGLFSGLRIMGVAHAGSTPDRIQLDLTKLLLRKGTSIQISASGLDSEGALGIQADVISGKALSVAGAMAGSFISGIATGSQTQALNGLGFAQTPATGRNALLQGIAQTASDQSRRLIDEATKEKPILIAEPGTKVTILINEEVKF